MWRFDILEIVVELAVTVQLVWSADAANGIPRRHYYNKQTGAAGI